MKTHKTPAGRDYFKELGVRRFINAAGTYTTLTASLMEPETIEAMNYASNYFVPLEELQTRVGDRIAQVLNSEAAMVTSGAAAALTLGTAGVLTGKDEGRISRIPRLDGMKSQVIVQRGHRFEFDHAVRICGVRLVEIDTIIELEKAINDKTALLLFINYQSEEGQISAAEFVEVDPEVTRVPEPEERQRCRERPNDPGGPDQSRQGSRPDFHRKLVRIRR